MIASCITAIGVFGCATGAADSSGAGTAGNGGGPSAAGGATATGGTQSGTGSSTATGGSPATGSGGAVTSSGGSSTVGAGGSSAGPCDKVVFDGEPNGHPLSPSTTGPGFVYSGWPQVNVAKNSTTTAAYGTGSMHLVLDPAGTCCGTFYFSWTNWDKGPGTPIDVSHAKALALSVKIDSGMYWNLMIELADANGKNSFTGADVHIADYVPSHNLDATWRRAVIPIDKFNTNGIDLTKISGVVIEGDRAVTFDVDEIVFTFDSC